MSKPPILLIDVPNLAHRLWWAFGQKTKVYKHPIIAGFLRDLLTLNRVLKSDRFVFCFDSKESIRKKIYPAYKANRQETEPKLQREIDSLQNYVLPSLGYTNILHMDGAEADDLIAMTILRWDWLVKERVYNKYIIVSSDKDLYQLLDEERVTIWNPLTKSTITQEMMEKRFGLSPGQWAEAKAIAGDSGDNIKGVSRVGMKTAIKYLQRGKVSQKAMEAIHTAGEIISRNMELVKLPCPLLDFNTAEMGLLFCPLDKTTWDRVVQSYGITGLIGKAPEAKRIRDEQEGSVV